MSGIDGETKRKLREMGAAALLEALESEDENLVLGMGFDDRLRLVVDEAHQTFNHAKVEGLIRRAGLRYPGRIYVAWIGSRNAGWIVTFLLSWVRVRSSSVSRTWCSRASPVPESPIWGARWRSRPVNIGSELITSVCRHALAVSTNVSTTS